MDSTDASSALGSLSSNWVYLIVGVLVLVLGYFMYKRYFGARVGGTVSFAEPLSAPSAGNTESDVKEAEVEEYEDEDNDKDD